MVTGVCLCVGEKCDLLDAELPTSLSCFQRQQMLNTYVMVCDNLTPTRTHTHTQPHTHTHTHTHTGSAMARLTQQCAAKSRVRPL